MILNKKILQSISMTNEEIQKLLTKYVEKKSGKKVVSVGNDKDGYLFIMEDDNSSSVIEDATKE
jgi:hypothetical protein